MTYNGTVIRTKGVSKTFKPNKYTFWKKKKKDIEALKAVNLDVKSGEVFGLLGKNGAGKTTLIRILTGLIKSTSGEAEVFGQNVNDDIMEIRKKVSLLPQEASPYETLTAKENILYYAGIQGQLSKREAKERTDELIQLIGLEGRENDLVKDFSGGMKRKVLVARALVTNPDLIFLDEPTSGIDIMGARVIRNLIKTLAKESNKTFFLTTHDLTDLSELCDRVGIIHDGKLVAVGSVDELEHQFKKSGLEDLFIGLTTGEVDFE
jgi:ABC-2 type transport system ATP-binding protein